MLNRIRVTIGVLLGVPFFVIGAAANLMWNSMGMGWCYIDEKFLPDFYKEIKNAK